MADEIIIETTSAEVIEVGVPGPQGPAGAAGAGLATLTTAGDLLYRNNSEATRLPIGSNGQVLKVSGGLPAWANESGAVTSVNGATGAVTVAAAQHATEHEAGEADEIQAMAAIVTTDDASLNGIYVPNASGTTSGGRLTLYKTGTRQNTKLEYNQSLSVWHLIKNTVIQLVGQEVSATYAWTPQQWLDERSPQSLPNGGTVTRAGLEVLARRAADGTSNVATATTSEDGLLSSADKTKLNGIAANATANTASSATPSALGTAAAGSATDYARADHTHSAEVSDSAFRVTGSTDATKKVALEVDTNVPANTTVTLTAPSSGGTIALAGAAPSAHAASHAAGTKAQFSGQAAGMTENVIIRANNAGTAGNSITLIFDGVDDIDTVLAAWNSANPSNQATLFGNGSQVPDNGEEITLSGGVAGGSDPFKNINQDLGTTDEVNFAKITLTAPDSGEVIRIDGIAPSGGDTGFAVYNTTGNQANSFYFNQNNQYVGIGVGDGEGYIQANVPLALPNIKNSLVIRDGDGGQLATFDANTNLTANRTYDLPDRSGELMIVGDAPASHAHGNLTNDGKIGSTSGLPVVTTTAGAVTTLALGTAGQVLRTKSDLSGVEFADPAASGVTSVSGTAPIVSSGGTTPTISVTTGSTAGTVAAGDDSRITGAAQKSANLSDLASASTARTNLGLAAIAASGSASDLGSGTVPIARLGASGTPSGSTYLAGDNTWKSVTGGVSAMQSIAINFVLN